MFAGFLSGRAIEPLFDLARRAIEGEALLRSLSLEYLGAVQESGHAPALARVYLGRELPERLETTIRESGLPRWEAVGACLAAAREMGGLAESLVDAVRPVLGRHAALDASSEGLLEALRKGAYQALMLVGGPRSERIAKVKALSKAFARSLRAARTALGLPLDLAMRLDETELLILGAQTPELQERFQQLVPASKKTLRKKEFLLLLGQARAELLQDQSQQEPVAAEATPDPPFRTWDRSRKAEHHAQGLENAWLELGFIVDVLVVIRGVRGPSSPGGLAPDLEQGANRAESPPPMDSGAPSAAAPVDHPPCDVLPEPEGSLEARIAGDLTPAHVPPRSGEAWARILASHVPPAMRARAVVPCSGACPWWRVPREKNLLPGAGP